MGMAARRQPAVPIALLALSALLIAGPARAEEPTLLWPAPETNALGASVFSGYSFGEQLEGPPLGARMLFFFRYFVLAISGDMTFVPDGNSFSMLVNLDGRYGPVRLGLLAGLHWLPGKGGSPSAGLGAHAGLMFPTGLDGLWFDLSYRPNLIFLESGNLTYHSVHLGVIIEAGL
jgi:hypothetical protein